MSRVLVRGLRAAVLAFALSLAGLVGSAHATTVLAVDVVDQAVEADALIEAIVGDSRVVRGERVPFTETELSVVRVLGGDAPASLVLRQVGGEIDGVTTVIAGDAKLVKGQRVAAFVAQTDGKWHLVALAQSVWHIEGEGPKAPVYRDLGDSNFMERDHAGAVVPAMQSPREYANYGELLADARGLTFGGAR
ncbi:MAG: hypothetical protein R3F61_14380 [Myxococcota bacterium]